ncbi:hypothetical protein TNCV_4432851 [Trichonephila clavipes]|nr:hypothetical protein TNCV_4432851 [Trichonephila clavipes]
MVEEWVAYIESLRSTGVGNPGRQEVLRLLQYFLTWAPTILRHLSWRAIRMSYTACLSSLIMQHQRTFRDDCVHSYGITAFTFVVHPFVSTRLTPIVICSRTTSGTLICHWSLLAHFPKQNFRQLSFKSPRVVR